MIPDKQSLIPYIENRREAAEKFKVTEKTITNWLKRYDLYKPKQNFGCNKLNFEKAVEIRQLYKEGTSIKFLASKYKVTFATISRIINNLIYKEKTSNMATINVIYNLEQINEQKACLKASTPPDDIE